jgi:hypothetical protein
MKLLGACITLFGCLTLAAPAIAYPPQPGVYQSTDLGGPVLPGRDLEGWPSGASLLSGVTVNMYSWVDTPSGPREHGDQWFVRCVEENGPAVLLVDNVDGNGSGYRTYERPFAVSNSVFVLSTEGPWKAGDITEPLVGTLVSYTDQVTVQYVNHAAVAATSRARAAGRFWYYPGYSATFEISNGVLAASGGVMDVYPYVPAFFYLPGCVPSAPEGARWEQTGITITIIGPPVPARNSSWGRIKSLYR